MVSAKPELRRAIADIVEHLVAMLDEIDGDPDFELEPLEEQHDLEDDPAEYGIADKAALGFVLAESARRQRRLRP